MNLDEIFDRTQKISDGHLIFEEGMSASYAYLIKVGKAKVLKNINGERVQIGTLKKGDIFGDMNLLGRFKNSATVVADGNLEVGMVSNSTFLEAVNRLSPELRIKIGVMVKELAHISELNGHLIARLQELESFKERISDLKIFEKEIGELPDLLSKVIFLLATRLKTSNEGCAQLAAQLEEKIKNLNLNANIIIQKPD
ncbi:MAG TPA: cyclic nucleotide-binding domain-containing protein [Nitrospiria bacterium]|jgi:CRP-like cAMP-binding protein